MTKVTIKPAVYDDKIYDYREVSPFDFVDGTEDNYHSLCANYAIKYLKKRGLRSAMFQFWIIMDETGEMLDVVEYTYIIDRATYNKTDVSCPSSCTFHPDR